jgi:hypothetical protein
VNNDRETAATLTLVILLVAALIYFGLPPSYVAVGPFSLGEQSGICHGMRHDGAIWLEACK